MVRMKSTFRMPLLASYLITNPVKIYFPTTKRVNDRNSGVIKNKLSLLHRNGIRDGNKRDQVGSVLSL